MSVPNDPNGVEWAAERERQKAFDRLDKAPRGQSVVDSNEERRLYDLARRGIDDAIRPPPPVMRCPSARRHKAHEWTNGAGAKRRCGGAP